MVNALVASELSAAGQVTIQRRRSLLLGILAVLVSVICAAVVLIDPVVSIVLLPVGIVLAAVVSQPRFGLYIVIGMVLLFETASPDQLMLPGFYFQDGLGNAVGLGGLLPSPLELLLFLACIVWLTHGILCRRLEFRGGRLFWAMRLFVLALLFGVLRGLLEGAELRFVLWEARFLFYSVYCYVLASNTIRTRRHVAVLTAIIFFTTGLYAIEGVYRRVALIDTGQLGEMRENFFEHESTVFLATLIVLILVQQVFGAARWQRILGVTMLPIAVFTMLATERRAGQIALIIGFLVFALILLVVHRKAFVLLALPIMVGGAIYIPLFWSNTGIAGQPARAIRSLYEPDERDAASNWARELEKINIRATIAANPILGVGFGRPYLFVVSTPDISWWPLWQHETHRNILWVWLKTGALGFIAFWILMGTSIVRAAHLARTLHAPELRTFALLALIGIITSLVFCYVDLGLTGGRVPVFLGTIIGTLSVLDQIHATSVLTEGEKRHARLGSDLHTQSPRSDWQRGRQRSGEYVLQLRRAGRRSE